MVLFVVVGVVMAFSLKFENTKNIIIDSNAPTDKIKVKNKELMNYKIEKDISTLYGNGKLNDTTKSKYLKLKNIHDKFNKKSYLNNKFATNKFNSFNFNTIINSYNQKVFVLFNENEFETKEIHFGNSLGEIIKSQNISIYPKVRFSHNGKLIEIINQFGNEIYLFNVKGELIFKGDYQKLIKNKNEILLNVRANANGDKFIIETNKSIYLIVNNHLKWKTPINNVMDFLISDISNKVVLINKNKNSKFDIRFLSLENGHLIDVLENLKSVSFRNENIIIEKNKSYYEYSID